MKIDWLIEGLIIALSVCMGVGVQGMEKPPTPSLIQVDDEPDYEQKDEEQEVVKELSLDNYEGINEDMLGIISIDGVVEEPFVQGEDNVEYLRKTIYKEDTTAGVCFMDYRNTLDSHNMIIYGHSSKYRDILFTALMGYKEYDFYQKHPIITIKTGEIRKYQIFSVYLYDVTGKEVPVFMKEDWSKYMMFYGDMKNAQNRSIYNTNVDISNIKQCLTIVTCNTENDNERLILMAKRIENEE